MAGFLGGLFESKAARPSEAIARATGSSPGAYAGGMALRTLGQWDIDHAVKNGMERVIWVFRAVDVIAQNQASVPILLHQGMDRSGGAVIDDPRLWKLLNFRCNSYERAWQFRYRLTGNLLLSKRGAFIEVVNGRDGRPSELHLLPAGTTAPIPDPKRFVSGYEVLRSDFRVETIPADRVIWLKAKPHPTDPYSQMTPLQAAGLAVETDFFARLFNRNFLMNDGRPGLIVSIKGNLNPMDAETIKARFGGGPANAGQTTVIEAEGMDVADMAGNPRDIQWDSMLQGSKEDILMAFGVPESVMGNASGRTFDNADAERENFWLDTMMPHCDNLAAGLDPLTADINDDTVLGFDYDTVDVIQRVARRKREEWRAEVAAGLMTIDEYFEKTGREKWDVVGTRILWHTSGIAIAKSPEDQAAITTLKPVGQPEQPGNEETARRGALTGTQQGMRELSNILAARAIALTGRAAIAAGKQQEIEVETKDDVVDAEIVEEKGHPYLGLRHRLEGAVEGVLLGWDTRQEKVLSERLTHVKARRGTRHWDGPVEGETKALNTSYVVDVDRWADELKAALETIIRRQVGKEMSLAARDMADNGVLDAMVKDGSASEKGIPVTRVFGSDRSSVADEIVGLAMDVVDRAARNQSKRVERKIKEMDAAGASMRQIEAEVRKMIGSRSNWRKQLATNVVTSAVEGARAATFGKGEKYLTKTWNTVDDERVRVSHRQVDQKVRRADRAFKVGAGSLMFPGDPTGPVEEVINCRCWLEWKPDYQQLSQ